EMTLPTCALSGPAVPLDSCTARANPSDFLGPALPKARPHAGRARHLGTRERFAAGGHYVMRDSPRAGDGIGSGRAMRTTGNFSPSGSATTVRSNGTKPSAT